MSSISGLAVFAAIVLAPFFVVDCRASEAVARDRVFVASLRASGQVIENKSSVVWFDEGSLTADEARMFAKRVDVGTRAILSYLGDHVDLPGGRSKVELYVSTDARGPRVTLAPEPWVFIPSEQVRAGEDPYLHEIVHAAAQWSWRWSEWTAEGFANHVATAVAEQGAGYVRSRILPNGLQELAAHFCTEAGATVLPLVGIGGRRGSFLDSVAWRFALTTGNQRWKYAPPFYAFSWSFTDDLIAEFGIRTYRRIAESARQDRAAVESTGQEMHSLLERWRRSRQRSSCV